LSRHGVKELRQTHAKCIKLRLHRLFFFALANSAEYYMGLLDKPDDRIFKRAPIFSGCFALGEKILG